ncbi:MAG: peptide chain release factor 1 [Desulfobulbaceae bacterium S3730MH12]|nr:MAG: peptide chain release factor 1 [Desulfobulbaceae bacterium S5133MH15]OEU54234.1 MAG: peptide chain release factor 1 [Desulfobulbaceae bacterium S3730MH12]OEU82684.1 MAG: peptide chain release factor 1 [Desulfobulbaceae bacterium C00003063]
MFDKFADLEDKISQLEGRLSDPELVTNQKEFRKVVKEHAHLTKLNTIYSSFRQVQQEIEESKALLHDEDEDLELKELARAEIEELETKEKKLDEEIKLILLPRDPNDEKNTFLEIRAGTGGDEAALFVGDLFRMYSRFAESMGWRVETISSSPLGIGGFKEIIALISGDKVYSKLKFESGVHRVQRVPETETQGRVHTSAVTVAILPEADEVELNIDMNELKIDVFRSSGPGGQSVNTTDSAIRITHLPTGLVVICQDEKSQHKNKAKALTVLRARLLDQMEKEHHDKISQDRKSQVGSGDRSERIRTYNFPQGRMTDHRINLTLYKLEAIVSGKLEEVIFPLIAHDQAEKLKEIQ